MQLLLKGDWWTINYRLQLLFRQIDLKNVYLDKLNLTAEKSHYYADSGGAALEKVLDSFHITPQDAIIDFGSGKGGALITLAKYPFARITGVEISPELIAIARRNLKKLWIDNVDMALCDAAEFTELEDYNYVYFFSPFPSSVMQIVIKNLKGSLAKKPRKMTIIYLNPECHEAVVTDSPFVKQQEFEHPTLRYYIYSNKV